MGRAMLIIASGAVIIYGMIQLGLVGQKKLVVERTAGYAKDIHAKNTAFTAIQLAMEEINQDNNWHPTEGSPWVNTIEGSEVTLYYDYLGFGASLIEPDTIRMYSTSVYDDETAKIVSTFTKVRLDFVPEFKSALSFATDQFTFSAGGNALVSGNDASGTCSDKPAITVQDEASAEEILGPDGVLGALFGDDNTDHLESSVAPVAIDSSVSYSPVDQLIARLASQPGTVKISGNYKGSLGTANNPGVFFVENYAKLTGGIDAGYGIMVIRSGGELEYEGELSVAGNFEFNGLIIFENAFNFTGRGTPDLNGSVLVGTTENSNSTLRINLGGNIKIQYNCAAESYAKVASASLLKQNRYIRLSTFE